MVFGAITRGRGGKILFSLKKETKKRKRGAKMARKRISGVIAK